MRHLALIPLLLSTLAFAQPAAHNPKAALHAYQDALQAEHHGDFGAALASLRAALDLDPGNADYQRALALLRAQTVQQYQTAGDQALAAAHPAEAVAQFRSALELDPSNGYVQQRLRDASALMPHTLDWQQLAGRSAEVQLAPSRSSASLQFTGDSRALLTAVAEAFGLRATFDEKFSPRIVELRFTDAGFSDALKISTALTHTMWAAIAPDEIFFAADTPEDHRQYDRMISRSFYLNDLTSAQELNDVANTLRTVFNIRYLTVDTATSLITIRASQPVADAAAQYVHDMSFARPQVMLEVHAFEINQTYLRKLGVQLPTQFQLINIPPQILALLSQGNIQQQINQILSTGTITAAQQTLLQNLENQLQLQQASGLTNLLNEPFITFGHGRTLFALAIPAAIAANFSANNSSVKDLKDVDLRAAQGDTATMQIGERFPVLTSSFSVSNGLRSGGLSSFPSFEFVDLGLTLKAKPSVHLYSPIAGTVPTPPEITLALEVTVQDLAGQSLNSVPIIAEREYKGSVQLVEGEPAVVVGSISQNDSLTLSGLPGFSQIPLVNKLLSNTNVQTTEDEVLITITPHIVRLPGLRRSNSIWLAPGQ